MSRAEKRFGALKGGDAQYADILAVMVSKNVDDITRWMQRQQQYYATLETSAVFDSVKGAAGGADGKSAPKDLDEGEAGGGGGEKLKIDDLLLKIGLEPKDTIESFKSIIEGLQSAVTEVREKKICTMLRRSSR